MIRAFAATGWWSQRAAGRRLHPGCLPPARHHPGPDDDAHGVPRSMTTEMSVSGPARGLPSRDPLVRAGQDRFRRKWRSHA